MNIAFWSQLGAAFGFGVLSSLVPAFNSEIFIAAAQASRTVGPLALSIGLALGHGLGKQIVFLAIRRGKDLPYLTKHREREVPPGSWRARWRAWGQRTALIVETPHWGYPLLFVSAVTGIPPVFAVVMIAATTKMHFWWFSLVVTVGFFVRCYLLALGTGGLFNLWFH